MSLTRCQVSGLDHHAVDAELLDLQRGLFGNRLVLIHDQLDDR